MSAQRETSRPTRRQIFVLTPEEKKTICFVLVAFVLGLATRSYRDNHPVAATEPTAVARGHSMPTPSSTSRR